MLMQKISAFWRGKKPPAETFWLWGAGAYFTLLLTLVILPWGMIAAMADMASEHRWKEHLIVLFGTWGFWGTRVGIIFMSVFAPVSMAAAIRSARNYHAQYSLSARVGILALHGLAIAGAIGFSFLVLRVTSIS